MKTTIKKEDVFDELAYNQMMLKIKILCKWYMFLNAISFNVFETQLIKKFEKQSRNLIDNLYK